MLCPQFLFLAENLLHRVSLSSFFPDRKMCCNMDVTYAERSHEHCINYRLTATTTSDGTKDTCIVVLEGADKRDSIPPLNSIVMWSRTTLHLCNLILRHECWGSAPCFPDGVPPTHNNHRSARSKLVLLRLRLTLQCSRSDA